MCCFAFALNLATEEYRIIKLLIEEEEENWKWREKKPDDQQILWKIWIPQHPLVCGSAPLPFLLLSGCGPNMSRDVTPLPSNRPQTNVSLSSCWMRDEKKGGSERRKILTLVDLLWFQLIFGACLKYIK
jgi:hypothetical protein